MKGTIVVVAAMLWFGHSLGQGTVTSVYPNTGFPGQNITVSLIGQNSNFYSTTALYLDWNEFFYIPTNSWTPQSATHLIANFTIPANAPAQTFNFMPLQFSNGTFTVLSGSSNLSYVEGVVYQDANTNCTNDVTDPKVGGTTVTLNPGGYTVTSDISGRYNTWVPPGNYTATVTAPPGYQTVCPVSLNWAVNIPNALDSMTVADFGMQSTPYQDVQVYFVNLPLRPGIPRAGMLSVTNVGNYPFSGTVTLIHDTMVVPGIGNFNVAPNSYAGNTAVWNISLAGGATFECNTSFSATLTSQIGDSSFFRAYVDTTANDVNPSNNDWQVGIRVANSYDPNDIAVHLVSGANAEGLITQNDSALVYKVRFQNTGTDTAYNVVVRDTLDPDLDPSTIRLLGSSHNYTFGLSANGAMEFSFLNIMLPDSFANEPASNGYFIYEVRQRPNLPDGTDIENSASIYFDYNPPVLTNTVISTVCAPVAPAYSYSATGMSVAFADQSTGNILSRTWDFGDGNASTALNPSHVYASAGVYNVCLTTVTACRTETHCEWVTICQEPTAAYQSSASQLNVSFTDQSSSSAYAWYWDFGDGGSSTLQSPSHSYAMPGAYMVCLTVTDSCSMSSYCDTVVVSCAVPQAVLNYTVSGLQVQFSDNTPGTVTSLLWDFGDGNTSTASAPTHTYASGGTYTVCLQVENDCAARDTACVTLPFLVHRREPGPFRAINFYPNPNDGRFHLETELGTPGRLRLRVYDLQGRMLSETDEGEVQGSFRRQVDLGELARGSYFLQFDLDGWRVNRIFTVQD